jgi:putative hydrolase of the HAD superfamily
VLTSSIGEAFGAFGATLGPDADPRLPLRLLAEDEPSRRLLAGHEEGRLSQREFETGFAERLRAHGAAGPAAEADGLLERILAGLRPDPAMLELVQEVRSAGVPVGLLSNSLGDDGYRGYDLPSLFDAVAVSGKIGARKPSRRAYRIACERLGVRPEATVMVDDLPQNLVGAERIGIAGVLHREAGRTGRELRRLLGLPGGAPTGQQG